MRQGTHLNDFSSSSLVHNNNFDFVCVFAVNFQEFTDQVAHTLYTHTLSLNSLV